MSRARILHVFKYFRPQFTGEGIFTERLAREFARLRPDVIHEVAVTTTPDPHNLAVPGGLAAVHYLNHGGAGASQGALISWLAGNAGRYAVVHYHTHVDRTFAASLILKLRGCRLVLSATLDDSIEGLLKTYRPLLRPLVRHLSRVMDRFVAISPRLHAETSRYVPPGKSILIPIGIAIPDINTESRASARERLSIPANASVLVSVGGLCARKDQLFLVRQMPALIAQNPNLMLILVGPEVEADYAAKIRQYIADHALHAHVRLAGYSEAPWDYYTAADIMVFASHEEGFGTVVIEALAYGLPVIARHLPDVNDVFVDHGRSGYLFTRDEEFQEHAKRLLNDVKLRQRMGTTGRDFVVAHYNIADIAARYLALYGFPAEGRG